MVGVSGGTSSSPSAPDIATAIQFTNDPLLSGSDINGTLIADTRLAVDAVRASVGLVRSWTDYSAPTGLVLATIFYESSATSPPRDLFNGLNQGRTALGLLPMAYPSGISLPAVNGDIRWQHLDTIRVGVK